MAKARSWQALSPAYRSRLERGGITRSAYESGASVSAARGHAKTPERPSRAEKNPARYPEYSTKRKTSNVGSNSAKLARDLKKIGKRYDIPNILSIVAPADRAEFIAGWQIAHAEYESGGSRGGSYGRSRLDDIESNYPDTEKALGFYH